jgi:hypothetical protein
MRLFPTFSDTQAGNQPLAAIDPVPSGFIRRIGTASNRVGVDSFTKSFQGACRRLLSVVTFSRLNDLATDSIVKEHPPASLDITTLCWTVNSAFPAFPAFPPNSPCLPAGSVLCFSQP